MKKTINFVGKFNYAFIFSTILMIATVVGFFTKGLNYGVDFRGGAEIQVQFSEKIELENIRTTLSENGFGASQVQTIGDEDDNEVLVKVQADESNLNEVSDKVSLLFKEKYSAQNATIRKTDIVGPKAGAELRSSGFQAIVWAFLMIMIYVGLRFDFKFAPGAIYASIHDVMMIVGFFIITQKEFSLQIVGALLAIIGYSVNDTVVIYDRVRENEDKNPSLGLRENINVSLNETLSRTILTSLTTFIISFIMLIMGGGVIHDFFIAICIGVFVGTYSTVFIASPITLWLDGVKKNKSAAPANA